MRVKKDRLFLLQPDFEDPEYPGKRFYCSHCALIEGVIRSFPLLTHHVDVERVNWRFPRSKVIAVMGKENQTLPLLVLAEGSDTIHKDGIYEGLSFVTNPSNILAVLSERHGIPFPHP